MTKRDWKTYIDWDYVIENAREIAKTQPDNMSAVELVAWVDALDHKPTDLEFRAWFKARQDARAIGIFEFGDTEG